MKTSITFLLGFLVGSFTIFLVDKTDNKTVANLILQTHDNTIVIPLSQQHASKFGRTNQMEITGMAVSFGSSLKIRN